MSNLGSKNPRVHSGNAGTTVPTFTPCMSNPGNNNPGVHSLVLTLTLTGQKCVPLSLSYVRRAAGGSGLVRGSAAGDVRVPPEVGACPPRRILVLLLVLLELVMIISTHGKP